VGRHQELDAEGAATQVACGFRRGKQKPPQVGLLDPLRDIRQAVETSD
jgi:hypothetical protein